MSLDHFGQLPEKEAYFKHEGDDSRAVIDFLSKLDGMNFMVQINDEHSFGYTREELGVGKLSRYILGAIADYKEDTGSDTGFVMWLYDDIDNDFEHSNLYLSIGTEDTEDLPNLAGGLTGEEKLWIEGSEEVYDSDVIYQKAKEVGITGPNANPEV